MNTLKKSLIKKRKLYKIKGELKIITPIILTAIVFNQKFNTIILLLIYIYLRYDNISKKEFKTIFPDTWHAKINNTCIKVSIILFTSIIFIMHLLKFSIYTPLLLALMINYALYVYAIYDKNKNIPIEERLFKKFKLQGLTDEQCNFAIDYKYKEMSIKDQATKYCKEYQSIKNDRTKLNK